ncbi:MAG: T9SS type A sorting domain-containing protein [Ignavibacteriaceae bacterium]|nr:T9SS type A sorting domain-containing protein [Ignavibacteriaceae bacterium]
MNLLHGNTTPAQCPDLRSFQFKVTAVDLGSHESDPSNIVESRLVGGPPSKAGAGDPGVETVIEYSLSQNYPNPFNPTTTINYSIKTTGLVTLKVYDMLGVEVASLVNENQEAGNYSVTFNASELPSGIYFYTLTSGNFIVTKKLILLR